MTDFQEHKCKNGATVKVYTDNAEVALAAFAFYDSEERFPWRCPFCNHDEQWDSLTYEIDGDNFEDTYTCDACDTLVTFITPKDAGEYHKVFMCDVTYMIEFMWGGEPSTWGQEEESDDDPLSLTDRCPQCQDAPDYYECSYCGRPTKPVVVDPDQPELL